MKYKIILAAILACCLLSGRGQGLQPTFDITEKGTELFESGRYRAAQAELTRVRGAVPDSDYEIAERIDFMLARCAVKLSENNARDLLRNFVLRYPNSIYSNDIRFSIADSYYTDGNYPRARDEYLSIDRSSLPVSERGEYLFKLAYSYFMERSLTDAYATFSQVPAGPYRVHADYYMAYIEYTNGNYAAAKRGFRDLGPDPSYGAVIPYYLLQIEFLEGNYDYVVSEGDALMSAANPERASEIARVMGESWFHKGDYGKTLRYIDIFRQLGGTMGRTENYLAGYSYYMQNDITDAVQALTLVCGPDDKLTQNAAYHLGAVYLRRGDKREAMKAFSMAAGAEFDPELREEALFNYGKLQFELGGGVFNEAINILTSYIDRYPNSVRTGQARELLASAYYNSRNYEAAYEAIRLVPDPDNNIRTAFQKIAYFRGLEYYADGRYDQALAMFDESLRNSFNAKYTALSEFWKGETLYAMGRFAQAEPLYRSYLNKAPATEREYSMARYNLGYTHFNLRRWDEAGSWFDRFITGYGSNDIYLADAYNRQGDVRYVKRQFWPALESYEKAAGSGTDARYYAQFQSAVLYGLVGRPDRKIESLRQIIDRGQGGYVGDAMYELGSTYLALDRYSDAASMLRRFTDEYTTSDKFPAALSALGLTYLNMGDNDTALRYYKRIIERMPNTKEAQDAMLVVRSLYVEMNDIDGYFKFAAGTGMETDSGIIARDSLTYAAAERAYLSSGAGGGTTALRDYLAKFPRGVYRPNALFYSAEGSIAAGDQSGAAALLKELVSMSYNSFTIRALERLAPILAGQLLHGEAADAYLQLARTAVNPHTVNTAYDNYLEQLQLEGNAAKLAEGAVVVETATNASPEVKRNARFARAQSLYNSGRKADAEPIFRDLATETVTRAGAVSTLRVVEYKYQNGDLAGAEQDILRFAESATPHTYELGQAFLILGDIYIRKGDTFQARATLQSIVDGYSPSDDGIVAAAREKINNL